MVFLTRISESLYVALCHIIGTEQEVVMRRDTTDIRNMVENQRRSYHDYRIMWSGSDAEGFRLPGSDVDIMWWPNDHKVICDLSQGEHYIYPRDRIIIMENSYTRPGFTLLQLITQTDNMTVFSSCVGMNGNFYVSSSLHRQITCPFVFPDSTIHGPCGSGNHDGLEYDNAHCFASEYWPQLAIPFAERRKFWPPSQVVQNIVSSGCHFVAIGNRGSQYEENEWRISFSQAEKQLVYAMTHCQFLVYGLLKVFLKEVINAEANEKLLCSYFMKTLVFWEIQENQIPVWSQQNLLLCFWSCFKHLLRCVYFGELPNFFIPENNMFLGKIRGSAQLRLFSQLYKLYKMGLSCLLLCPSICSSILDVINDPSKTINTNDNCIMPESYFDFQLLTEVDGKDGLQLSSLSVSLKYLQAVEIISHNELTPYHAICLQKLLTTIFQSIAFHLLDIFCEQNNNETFYTINKISVCMLKFVARFGCVSDMLYIAMYYYRTLRYRKAVAVLECTRVKLSQSYVMYMGRVDVENYIEAVSELSWSRKMREALAVDLMLSDHICYINELKLEQRVNLQNSDILHVLTISPFVMLDFLCVLCYNNVDTVWRQQALNHLYVILIHHDIVTYDDGNVCLSLKHRDISWQILGICQELCMNWQGAMISYQESLRHEPYHNIERASSTRIQNITRKILSLYQTTVPTTLVYNSNI